MAHAYGVSCVSPNSMHVFGILELLRENSIKGAAEEECSVGLERRHNPLEERHGAHPPPLGPVSGHVGPLTEGV